MDIRTGRLWAHEHGAKGGDELNLIVAGANYGGPRVTYGVEYNDDPIGEGSALDGMQQPAYYWVPDIAPSGLTIDSRDDATTFWMGTLVGESLVRLEMQDDHVLREVRMLQRIIGRIRDVKLGPEGFLYLVTDLPEGSLYRIRQAKSAPSVEPWP